MKLWGQKISNPVGLAAGFDKDGEAIDGECLTDYYLSRIILSDDIQDSLILGLVGWRLEVSHRNPRYAHDHLDLLWL